MVSLYSFHMSDLVSFSHPLDFFPHCLVIWRPKLWHPKYKQMNFFISRFYVPFRRLHLFAESKSSGDAFTNVLKRAAEYSKYHKSVRDDCDDDWDDEDDGEWGPPTIANPEYKGPWVQKKIKNPAYKGEWAPRNIPNPAFFNRSFGMVLICWPCCKEQAA